MISVIITLDYEAPQHRAVDVNRFMIEPTKILIEVCQQYGAKLTIMAEMAEIAAFGDPQNTGFNHFAGFSVAEKIYEQLAGAVHAGHDVQMHIHPQWIGARWDGHTWRLQYTRYRLTDFGYVSMVNTINSAKKILEEKLSGESHQYVCSSFRAGHWNTQPSREYLRALHAAGISADTSVFKWGYADSPSTTFDYRSAYSRIKPWMACDEDINRLDPDGSILEVPIYAEPATLLGLVSFRRIRMMMRYFWEDLYVQNAVRASSGLNRRRRSLREKIQALTAVRPRKMDFCKLTGREMIEMFDRAISLYGAGNTELPLPLVMIGHSKDDHRFQPLQLLLNHIEKRYSQEVQFTTLREYVEKYHTTHQNSAKERIA
ncbi:MAG: polysaccharide deacetylase family protein [Candidatus Latescibacterota bacterium]